MKKLATIAVIGVLSLGLAACGSTDDASTEAMPDTVEMPADEALEPIAEEPVADEELAPVDPAETAPSAATANEAADAAAVEAMRDAFNELDFDGTVVIGEGERDEAPMLYIGEKVGRAVEGGPQVDIALDPLEGTTITAKAGANALAVLAIAEKGCLLNAPDTYMDKMAIGPGYPKGTIDLAKSPTENVTAVAGGSGENRPECWPLGRDRGT